MMSQPGNSATASARGKLAAIIIPMLWFALASSLAGVMLHLGSKRLGQRWYLRLSQDLIWMTPVTDLIVFLVPALVLAILSRRFSRINFVPAALFIGSFLFFCSLLVLTGYLPSLAVLILSMGLAVRVTKLLEKRVGQALPFLELSAGTMAMLFAVLALLLQGERIWSEQQTLRALPPATPGAPNVLFITLDTVSADRTGLAGYWRDTTPNLQRWAKRGTVFGRAMATAPWTLPSHAGMFTGRYPHELSTTWRTPLDDTYPTLAEAAARHGYTTAGFVANRYYVGYESGLSRGFAHYEDYNYSPGEFVQSSTLCRWFCYQPASRHFFGWHDVFGRKNAAQVSASFLGWLDRRDEARPFFAFLNYFDAHDPYLPPAPFDAKFGPAPTDEDLALFIQWWYVNHGELPPERLEAAERAHDSCLAYLDHELGRLLDELQRRGVLDNTLVVITSDHGEHFGEHHLCLHGQSLYRELIHVPLVLIQPRRVPPGHAVSEYVTLRDLPATVLDLTGMEGEQFPGYSLARCWHESQSPAPAGRRSPVLQVAFPIPGGYVCPDHGCSPVASGAIVSLFEDGMHYIKNLDTGAEEIYDFERDPRELINLAALPARQELLERFRQSVQRELTAHKSRWIDFPPQR